jgi:hypothetical protein
MIHEVHLAFLSVWKYTDRYQSKYITMYHTPQLDALREGARLSRSTPPVVCRSDFIVMNVRNRTKHFIVAVSMSYVMAVYRQLREELVLRKDT